MGRSFNTYLIERIKREDELKSIDKNRWYSVNKSCLSEELRNTFHQLHYDGETNEFINNCYKKSESLFSMVFLSTIRIILRFFMSSTSVCGLLGVGSMFVFSKEQLGSFLSDLVVKNDSNTVMSEKQLGSLLDLGAGDGNVTKNISRFFSRTYVTEVSRFMQTRLLQHGYSLLGIDDWHLNNIQFDMISCLNLLDRCDQPLQMLADIHRCLSHSGGLLLLAIVFPLCQYVEFKTGHKPEETLTVEGNCFEHQLVSFEQNVLKPSGFQVIRWSKLPYLCEGNLDLTYFYLIDSVFLLQPVNLGQPV